VLVDFKATIEMSPELAAMSAQFCATVTMLFNTLAGAFAPLRQMNWVPRPIRLHRGEAFHAPVG
jgi:roadblock/LC7 domain-containing protein